MRFLIFLLLLFYSSLGIAQSKVDSLQNALQKSSEKTSDRVDLLNALGYEYWIIDSKKSIELGNEALSLSKEINYQPGIAKANRIVGVAHWTQGNHVRAIEFLDQAEKEYTALEDPAGVADSQMNAGMVYTDLKDYDKAQTLFEQAINAFTTLDQKSRIATTYTKLASIYIEQGRLYDAKTYLGNALTMHTEADFTYGMAEAHNRLGILYIAQNEREQAYYHLERSIILGKEINDEHGMVSNLIQYGKLLRLDNKLDAAEAHLNIGLKRAKENRLKKYELAAYEELKELKKAQGKPDEALEQFDRYTALKDSIFNSELSMQIAAVAFQNDLNAKEQEVQLLKEQERSNTVIKWSLIIGALGIALTSSLIIASLRQRALQNKELLRRKQELITSQEALSKTALENSQLKEKELQQQLSHKNKELTSYTLNFVQKNELLQQLQEQVQEAKNASPATKDKLIDQLNRTIKQHLTIDKDWEDFKRFFEEVHTDFHKKLKEKHPDLSPNDLKICSLTRLNLNIKETASVLGISPESAKTARYRLRKKLNLQTEDDLLSYFLQLESGQA